MYSFSQTGNLLIRRRRDPTSSWYCVSPRKLRFLLVRDRCVLSFGKILVIGWARAATVILQLVPRSRRHDMLSVLYIICKGVASTAPVNIGTIQHELETRRHHQWDKVCASTISEVVVSISSTNLEAL